MVFQNQFRAQSDSRAMASAIQVTFAKCAVLGIPRQRIP